MLEQSANGELIVVGGLRNGYRFANPGAADKANGYFAGTKVKDPIGPTQVTHWSIGPHRSEAIIH
jgi:hypothetical protein